MTDATFSRARNPDSPTMELSVARCPTVLVEMLDALSLHEGVDRGPFVISILTKWARNEARRTTLIQRVAGRNPQYAELARMEDEEEA